MVCQNKTAIAIAAGCSSTWDHTVTPEIVPFDNGSEFANEINGNAVRELGAEIEFGIAGEPNGRPVVERFLRTLDTGLLPFFTGRTFANIVERGDYNPQEMASVLVDVMSKALVRWIVDVYHNEPHAGLGCETPNDAWERCCEESGAMPPPDADRMRAIFGLMSKRSIGNRGIRHFGLYYKNRATGSMRAAIGQGKVLVKADPQNLGAISMRLREPGSPWITVPCEWDEFEGVSAEQWLGVARDLRHKHANAAKLREETVLAAIRDLDKMGRDAAEAAGVGPVYLTDERLRQSERDIFNAFDTVRTPRKGVAGWASRGEPTDRDGVAGDVSADAAPAVEPAPSPENGRNPIQRRRRGLGPSILKEE
jgi:putative transposase